MQLSSNAVKTSFKDSARMILGTYKKIKFRWGEENKHRRTKVYCWKSKLQLKEKCGFILLIKVTCSIQSPGVGSGANHNGIYNLLDAIFCFDMFQ